MSAGLCPTCGQATRPASYEVIAGSGVWTAATMPPSRIMGERFRLRVAAVVVGAGSATARLRDVTNALTLSEVEIWPPSSFVADVTAAYGVAPETECGIELQILCVAGAHVNLYGWEVL